MRHFRIQQGLTQAELAAKAGVSVMTLYKIEYGVPARLSSIEKICTKGLGTPFEALIQTRAMLDVQDYLLYRAEAANWYAPIDRRRSVPEENARRLQDPAERRRLGKLGFVSAFHNNPNIVMPDGPGTLFLEIHGRMAGPINAGVYRDCKLHLQAGRVRCAIRERTLEMFVGDMVGLRDADLRWIEPLVPLTPEEPPPLLLWMGAGRIGKAVRQDDRAKAEAVGVGSHTKGEAWSS